VDCLAVVIRRLPRPHPQRRPLVRGGADWERIPFSDWVAE
jgi:hypothetical protein